MFCKYLPTKINLSCVSFHRVKVYSTCKQRGVRVRARLLPGCPGLQLSELVQQVIWGAGVTEAHSSTQQSTCSTETAPLSAFLPAFSTTTAAMRLLFSALPILLVQCVGSIRCEASPRCPSGQFGFKSQCVLCHHTCAECDGRELFQCTTCGVCECSFSYRD